MLPSHLIVRYLCFRSFMFMAITILKPKMICHLMKSLVIQSHLKLFHEELQTSHTQQPPFCSLNPSVLSFLHLWEGWKWTLGCALSFSSTLNPFIHDKTGCHFPGGRTENRCCPFCSVFTTSSVTGSPYVCSLIILLYDDVNRFVFLSLICIMITFWLQNRVVKLN